MPKKLLMSFEHKTMDEKSQITENFDSMFAFSQHNGKIDYDTGKAPLSPSKEEGAAASDMKQLSHSGGVVGAGSSEYEKLTYPPLLLQYENTSSWYWHNLDERSNAALSELQEWIHKDNVQVHLLSANELHPSLL